MDQVNGPEGFWDLLGLIFLGVMLYEEYMTTQYNKGTTQRIFLAVLTWNTNLKKYAVSVT